MIIYKGTNLLNGKLYIGKTKQEFKKRLNAHSSNAFNKNIDNYNHYIYRAIRRYGWDNFSWEIIDTATTEDELNDKEKYWIKFHNTFGYKSNGYNMTEGGDGTSGYAHDDEMRLQIAIGHGSKPFHLFDFEGNLFKTYISKIQCEREMGLYRASIVDALNGKTAYSGQYILVYEEEYLKFGDDLIRKKIERARTSNKGSNRANAILDEEKVREIKLMLMKDEYSHIDIAEKFEVGRGLVGAISRGRDWKHVEVDGFVPRLTTYSKLKKPDIIEIKKMLINGVYHKDIAEKFDVRQSNISNIATGNTWSHVEVEGFTPVVRKGGELCPTAKLTKDMVIEIKKMLNQGDVASKIAKYFNIKKSAVYDIKQGRTWREIEG